MPHLAAAHCMTPDPHIVGGIGDHHLGEPTLQHLLVGLDALGIATDQTVSAELPNIARLGHCRTFGDKTGQIVRWIGGYGLCRSVYHQVVEKPVSSISKSILIRSWN